MERKMKDSGIPWIGQIPEHWEVTNLKQLLKFQKGSIPKAFSDTKLDIPYLTMDYLRGNEGSLTLYPIPEASLVTMNESDLIVLWDGANAGEFIVSKYGFLGSTMAKVIFDFNFFETKYLYYLLKALEPISKDFANGTTIPHFTPKFLYSYCYPIAPLSEQEAIAGYLDKKCGEIDELIEVEQQMISDLESYRQAVITEAVTHGLNPEVPVKETSIHWISSIPEHWKEIRLKFLSRISTGDKDTIMANDEGEYPFFVRSPKVERINTFSYDGEAILMAGDGVGAGRVFHHFIGKFDWHQRVYNLHDLSSNIYGRFLFYFLLTNFHKLIDAGSAKSTVDSVRLPMLTNFITLVPPLSEQQEIVDYLEAKCAEIDELIKVKQEKIETLKQYRQSLIFEAVTGKITIN